VKIIDLSVPLEPEAVSEFLPPKIARAQRVFFAL
jgi:hypothetical protein